MRDVTVFVVCNLNSALPEALRGGRSDFEEDDFNFEKDEPLIYKTIMTTLEMMVAIEQFHPAGSERNTDTETHNMSSLFLLLEARVSLPDEMLDKDTIESLSQLISRRGCDEHGSTILHIACTKNSFNISHLAIIRLILQAGADPNAGDGAGDGALHLAARLEEVREPIVLLLLEYGLI